MLLISPIAPLEWHPSASGKASLTTRRGSVANQSSAWNLCLGLARSGIERRSCHAGRGLGEQGPGQMGDYPCSKSHVLPRLQSPTFNLLGLVPMSFRYSIKLQPHRSGGQKVFHPYFSPEFQASVSVFPKAPKILSFGYFPLTQFQSASV